MLSKNGLGVVLLTFLERRMQNIQIQIYLSGVKIVIVDVTNARKNVTSGWIVNGPAEINTERDNLNAKTLLSERRPRLQNAIEFSREVGEGPGKDFTM